MLKEAFMLTKTRTLILATMTAAVISAPAMAWDKYNLLMGGYYNGPSVAGTIGVANIFEKVPLSAEISLGYSWTPAGDGTLARKVFINQDTGGDNDAQSSGGVLDFTINALYPLNENYGPIKFYVFGGPRIEHYDVRWDYVGGDEDFDIVSWVYGLGGGLRGVMPLGKKINAVLQLGIDYFPRTAIYGHDATYYPDNSNVNGRNDGAGYNYTYADAENATTVPHLRPRVMAGIQF
jgi:hypothetical protein